MNINEVLTIVNIFGAIWVSVSCVATSQGYHPDRDTKPLVLPIFISLAYIPMTMVVYLNGGEQEQFERTVRLMLESLWLVSTLLFIKSYSNSRGKPSD